MRRPPIAVRPAWWCFWLAVPLFVGGCGAAPPEAPHAMVAVSQARAREILARIFTEKGLRPLRGTVVQLDIGGTLDVDVTAEGHKFGVAYLTDPEIQAALPYMGAMPKDSGALKVVRGIGEDSDARYLVLASTNYVADDHLGAERDDTSITAESKLMRDARDFLARAGSAQWP